MENDNKIILSLDETKLQLLKDDDPVPDWKQTFFSFLPEEKL